MSSALILTIKQRGCISGPVKHTEKQKHTVDVTPFGAKSAEFMTRNILHNDRFEMECVKKLHISEDIVRDWERSDCPHWEKPANWKTFSRAQKIHSHAKRYEEGFGISYDFFDKQP